MKVYTAKSEFAPGKVKQEISIGSHRVSADVAPEEGGEGSAPSPHEYLAAALASCTSMTLRMYAQRKNWPLENVIVTVTLSKQPEKTLLETEIQLLGSLDTDQISRLMQISEHCPVHKTLAGQIEIKTALKT